MHPLLIVVAAITLASCGGGVSSPTATQGLALVTTGNGCGRAATVGSTTFTISVEASPRTVIVHVPKRYSALKPEALVLNMHGSGATAADQEAFSGMDTTADADNFIVAYPQGAIASGTGFDWNVPGQPLDGGGAVPAGSADDIQFLSALV